MTTGVSARMRALPRVTFVLGKGGVGRSTIATALGLELARRGERTCVFGWSVSDPIAPWFGLPAAGLMPIEIAPRLHVGNYRLDETLELYFVHHLKLPRFYRHVIDGVHVRRLIEAAPGIAEVFFIGHLWWLTTLAGEEAGLHFDRIVVDAPATGHGASLLDVPSVLSSLSASGLLAIETERVVRMMSDRAWTGAVVVSLPEELSAEETAELVPVVSHRLGRRPLVAVVNRSVADVMTDEPDGASLEPLRARLSIAGREGFDTVRADFRNRVRFEAALRELLVPATSHGVFSIEEALLREGSHHPRDVARAAAAEIGAWLDGEP